MSIYRAMKQRHGYSESWTGEHEGHTDPIHKVGSISNNVDEGGPNKTVYINNKLAATQTTRTTSSCGCCNDSPAVRSTFKQWSGTVYIHGEPAVGSENSALKIDHKPLIPSPSRAANVFYGN